MEGNGREQRGLNKIGRQFKFTTGRQAGRGGVKPSAEVERAQHSATHFFFFFLKKDCELEMVSLSTFPGAELIGKQ